MFNKFYIHIIICVFIYILYICLFIINRPKIIFNISIVYIVLKNKYGNDILNRYYSLNIYS